jgi:hypothetical protein
MATSDELRCMATLCANLNDAAIQLSGHAVKSSVEQEAIELLELMPQILEADVHPGRVGALLFQVEPPPLAAAARFTHSQMALSAKLRAFAVRTLTQVMAVALSPSCSDYLAPRIREVSAELHLVPLLLSLVAKGAAETDAEAAAELLFVLAMQLPTIRAAMVVDHGAVRVLLSRLAGTDADQLRSYLCATVRVLCQSHASAFIEADAAFFPIVIALLRDGVPSQATVLLLESITEVTSQHPSAYVALVLHDPALLDDLTDAVTALVDAPDESDERSAALGELIRTTLAIEGSSEAPALREGHGMRAAFCHVTAWQRAMAAAASPPQDTLGLLGIQRWLVATAVTRQHVLDLARPFMDSFPTLCVLLNPEKSSRECMTEVALLVSLCCAKIIAVRREVARMVRGYDGWAENIVGTIRACLRQEPAAFADRDPHGPPSILLGLFIVDEHQCLLNDPALLTRVESLDAAGVARALFAEQERRAHAASLQKGPASPLQLGKVRADLYQPTGHGLHSRAVEAAAALCFGVLERAAALAFTPTQVHEADGSQRGDPAAIAQNLSHMAQRQLVPEPAAFDDDTFTASGGYNTPRRRTMGDATPSRARTGTAVTPGRATTPSRARTPTQVAKERVHRAMKMFGGLPDKRPPFRPSSAAHAPRVMPLAVEATSVAGMTRPQVGSVAGLGVVTTAPAHVDAAAGQAPLLLEALTVRGGRNDEYISMAIMMHLPITYGVHYNRGSKAAVRKIAGPGGMYVQPVHRNTTHTWTALDVREGDIYVLFVPFHKLTADRVTAEIQAVERYLLAAKKALVTTPQQQRSRRWFLHDMLNYVLPKTELLLRELLSLLKQFGADNVVYQLGVIRLLDEGRREKQDVLVTALEESDAAMPTELLRLSSGRLKDILHSGNLAYACRRLREHFFPNAEDADGDGSGLHHLSPIGDHSAVVTTASPAYHHHGPGMAVPSQLLAIDREIERLERQAHDDRWGAQADAEAADDVEPAYDAPLHARDAGRMLDPSRYVAGGAPRDDEDEGDAPGGAPPPMHAPSPAKAVSGAYGRRSDVPQPINAVEALAGLFEHLRAAFERGEGTAVETASYYNAGPARGASAGGARSTSSAGGAAAQIPTLDNFEELYAAVERGYRTG